MKKRILLLVGMVVIAGLLVAGCDGAGAKVESTANSVVDAVEDTASKEVSEAKTDIKEAEKNVEDAVSKGEEMVSEGIEDAKENLESAKDNIDEALAKDDEGELELTVEELATYDGKDGQPAYVAVDGVIYDVTNVPAWANGEHKNGLTAGKDLTKEIKEDSPHGVGVLDDLPVVGTLR